MLHSQKKCFRRIYDLGVNCKGDCREILVDYSPAFHVFLSLSDAFLSAFLTFVILKRTAYTYGDECPLWELAAIVKHPC